MDKHLQPYFEFLEKEVIPLEPLLLDHQYDELYMSLDKLRQQVKKQGLWAPYLPVEHGGQSMALIEFAAVSEILGRSPLGHYTFNCQAPDIGNIELLSQFGSDKQKQTFLKPLMDADTITHGLVGPRRPRHRRIFKETVDDLYLRNFTYGR